MQRAVLSLAQGVMAGLRNPLVHETVELEPHEAMEMVAVISLVARWIQTGPFTSWANQNLSTGERP